MSASKVPLLIMKRTVNVPSRYAGFPGQALGGYVGGLMSAAAGTPLEVTFRSAAPVETDLQLESAEAGAIRLSSGDQILAEGVPSKPAPETPPSVGIDAARAASKRYPGLAGHLIGACFCCGTERSPGDGLRIFPGPTGDGSLLAAPWTPEPIFAGPDGSVLDEIVWSALDCPSIWALVVAAPSDSADQIVTGRLTVEVTGHIQAGRPHVVLAWPVGAEGRRLFAGAALFAEDGQLLALSQQTCVRVDRGVPLGLARWKGSSRTVRGE
jgi:hypothetical protein